MEMVQFREQSAIFNLIPCISEKFTKQMQKSVLNSMEVNFIPHYKIFNKIIWKKFKNEYSTGMFCSVGHFYSCHLEFPSSFT